MDSAGQSDRLLSRRLALAFVTPLALLLAVGGLLVWQLAIVRDRLQWVDHSDQVIAKAYEIHTSIVDQETAIRGYLLSEQSEYLKPFYASDPNRLLGELRALVNDNPDQVRRTDQVQARYQAWLELVRRIPTAVTSADRSLQAMQVSKSRMDQTREALNDLLRIETELRRERIQGASETERWTDLGLAGLLSAAALIIALVSRRQAYAVATTYQTALDAEKGTRARLEIEDRIRASHIELAQALHGDLAVEALCEAAIQRIASYTGADVGAVYLAQASGFRRVAAFALDAPDGAHFEPGQGVLGQAALENRVFHLKQLPQAALRVRSAVADAACAELIACPVSDDAGVIGVIELGFLRETEARALALLERVGGTLGAAIRSAQYKAKLRELVEETQRQSEELQAQQEEMRVANEELAEHGRALQQAKKDLEIQQTELERTNEDLREQTDLLARQNDALGGAQAALSARTAEAARANRYKSEFLANMSHELRTPLNSSLILAKLLADNKDRNLTPEQIKYASTIFDAGNDLLVLINDILDLSKIEAGKLDIHPTRTPVNALLAPLVNTFEPIANQKGLAFEVITDSSPESIETDAQRLQQILKNLLSNALKFTESGSVRLRVKQDGATARFEVEDSGIGIPPEQQQVIFEAFRQADGTTNRKYGGTGLGLSISRDLARLLGGEIMVASAEGKGALFTLVLPLTFSRAVPREPPVISASNGGAHEASPGPASTPVFRNESGALFRTHSARRRTPTPPTVSASVADDRERIEPGRRLILVVEDDPSFAAILVDLAHELDFQCIVAQTADDGVRAADEHAPSAVLLDMNLPDHSGLSVLDRLKRNPKTRHVPVHVVSALDGGHAALSMGAIGYLSKPVRRDELIGAFRRLETALTRSMRRVLVVEDDPVQQDSIRLLLDGDQVETLAVDSVAGALAELRASTFDCVVTDLSLSDGSGFDLLETLATDDTCSFPPAIVYTGRSLTSEEEQRIRKYSDSIIVKGARSPERLLDEVTLFLHQVESELPAERQRMLRTARDREAIFQGRSILIVEDDVRNVFALTSVLEPKGAHVEIARNGKEALDLLSKKPHIDLVLMDIMMPEMDGLTAIREIRKISKFSKLPIIALTAKATQDDHSRCLNAGANDYASKPLDIETLLSLLRVWMPR